MDWADDVAYSVHDVEDGVHAGYIRRAALDDPAERDAVCALAAKVYSDESAADLAVVLAELLTQPVVGALAGYDGSHGSMIALKQLTTTLVGRFSAAALDATRRSSGRRRSAGTTPTWSCRARSGRSARCSRPWRCGM